MSRALLFLWFTLFKKRAFLFVVDLRRPAKLLGFLTPLSLLGFLYYYHDHEFFGQLLRREAIVGCVLLMLAGSVGKGFLQRGIVFEKSDVEFLFTGPFAQHQIILYRLLPNYLYAVFQGLVFVILFGPHLTHPALATVSLVFFQVLCFHIATAAAIFGGSIRLPLHERMRWMMLGLFFVMTVAYLRVSFEIELVPSFVRSHLAPLLFYPAVTSADLPFSPGFRQPGLMLTESLVAWRPNALLQTIALIVFSGGAVASLLAVFRLKANVFETSVSSTERVAARRLRVQRGQGVLQLSNARAARTSGLPRLAIFQGVGALIWKNLMGARRCRRQLVLAAAFTAVFTLPLLLLLKYNNEMVGKNMGGDPDEILKFHAGVAIFLGFLAFLLQRSFPFDFRTDGPHLVAFRTLPMSPLAIVLAEIAVPTLLCLAFQAAGILALIYFGRFNWLTVLMIALLYPSLSLGVNAVWNTYYLLSATKPVGSTAQSQSPSAAGTLLVVALSFAVFFPAGWISEHLYESQKSPLAAITGFILVQYAVDYLLLQNLARLFQRFEVARDS